MYLVKERLDKVFARTERIVFQNEGKALDALRDAVKQSGGAFDEDYLRKVAHIYLNSIRSLLTQFEKQYIKVMHVVDESFTEHQDMLREDIKERGNAYIERFGIFFLDSDANPEKYADLYMHLVDEVRNEYQRLEAKVFEALGHEIYKEKKKKNLEVLIYVGWGIAAVIGIFCVFYFGRQNDWTIEMDPEQWFNAQLKQVEAQVLSDDADEALKQSDKLLEGLSPEKGPENYARLKKAQGDIFVKFAGMMQAKRREQLEKAVAAYEDALKAATPENMPVKNAQINKTLGEACLGIPEVGQTGEGLGAMVEQFGTDMEGLAEASQQVMALIDEEAYIERSIESFKQSLDVFNQLRWPSENATVHVNLGIAYAMLSQMKQTVPNIRKAMMELKTGIEYFTSDRYPLTYAIITNNIGVVYYYLCDFGEIEDLLIKAQKALSVAMQGLEAKGYKGYLYEVKLNEMRMRHQVEAMRLVRARSFSVEEKQERMKALRTRFDEEEEALVKPEEPDQFASYEIEFMVLGVSKMKL
jgi:tetratricopeptide (TPR) repeat protein